MFGLFLTFLKPLNTASVLWFILSGSNWLAATAIVWLMVCDIFDGFFFRRSSFSRSKNLSRFRRAFDVALDHIAIEAVLVVMVVHLNFPLYFYVIELIRDVILVGLLLYSYKVRRPLWEPNLLSRISALAVGLMATAWLIAPAAAVWFLIPIVVFGIFGSRQYYRAIAMAAA